jgi:hypothetical protein
MVKDHVHVERPEAHAHHSVSFDMFPSKTSPFYEYVKRNRMYMFGQLAAIYADSGSYMFTFDEVEIASRVTDQEVEMTGRAEDQIVSLRNAYVDSLFESRTVFDHVLASLGLSFLDHSSISFANHRFVGENGVHEADDPGRVSLGTSHLVNDGSETVITAEAVHTNDERLANNVRSWLEHIHSYFKGVFADALTGVSHKHYVRFLLEAFPGRVQVRQLPAAYAELQPVRRQALNTEEDDVDTWIDLADDIDDILQELDRTPSLDEIRLVTAVYQRTRQEDRVRAALDYVNEHASFFAEKHPEIAMRVIDTSRVLQGEDQRYNTLRDGSKAERHDVEAAFKAVLEGEHVDH